MTSRYDGWTTEDLNQSIINSNTRIIEINRQIGVLMQDRTAHEDRIAEMRLELGRWFQPSNSEQLN